ncbi:hypothetical protein [Nocardia sp. NPDC004260]
MVLAVDVPQLQSPFRCQLKQMDLAHELGEHAIGLEESSMLHGIRHQPTAWSSALFSKSVSAEFDRTVFGEGTSADCSGKQTFPGRSVDAWCASRSIRTFSWWMASECMADLLRLGWFSTGKVEVVVPGTAGW